jgi:4-nitrophenyl phosphatase
MTLRGAVVDVDGTVLRGDEALPGAREGLDLLAARGVDRVFVSNNPTARPAAYVDRFERAGIDVDAEEVLTAGVATVAHLNEAHAGERVHVVGEPGLLEQVRAADVEVVESMADADVLLASLERSFDYDRLSEALSALADDSVTFLGTDPDMVIPTADGDVPGSGAVVNAIAGVAGREPEATLGKPSARLRELALSRLGVQASSCLVVGDRLDTDVALGADAGMTTALVRTGVSGGSAPADGGAEPDYVLDSLSELDRVLDGE